MKPSEECKIAGLDSLNELTVLSGKSRQTLTNWHYCLTVFLGGRSKVSKKMNKEIKMLGTKEHYEVMAEFEKSFRGRFDKEPKELWKKGRVYQDGGLNNLYKVFLLGYSLGKVA